MDNLVGTQKDEVKRERIALLGSTGSIGEQTLKIISEYRDDFEITTLTANKNWERLAQQAIEFQPDSVVIADKQYYIKLKEALKNHPIKVYAGDESVAQITENGEVETVVNAMVGYAGLAPTIMALRSGKKLALANKESLVVAGEMVVGLSRENRAPIIPVDSEHSAIFQCLVGEASAPSKLILTASGGPFLDTPIGQLDSVTVEQALNHPNWEMGSKITIDSATMLNKGFEVMEAYWLFGMASDKIEVLVHPESIVHSMVEFADGALKAQLGQPDMRVPIQYALTFPYRLPIKQIERVDFTRNNLTFREVDKARFPALGLAYHALRRGGSCGCSLNGANEVAVEMFLEGRVAFTHIFKAIEYVLERCSFVEKPDLGSFAECDREARELAREFLMRKLK